MKINKTLAALIAGASLGLSGQAMAVGTQAGTLIPNIVTLNYNVSGISQESIDAGSVFTVDNRIDMTLAWNDTVGTIIPGATVAYHFTLENPGNLDQTYTFATTSVDDLYLDADNTSTRTTTPTAITYYSTYTGAGDAGNVTFTAASGLAVQHDDEGGTANQKDFWVEITYPNTLANGDILANAVQISAVLDATTDNTGLTDKNATGNLTKQLAVYAEAISINGDGAYDGNHSVAFGSQVETAFFEDGNGTAGPGLTVQVVNDPLCNPDNSGYTLGVVSCASIPGYTPKAIPGALVEYTLTAKNASTSVAAEHAVFTHSLDAAKQGTLANVKLTVGVTPVADLAATYDYGTPATTYTINESTASALDVNVEDVAADTTVTITFTAVIVE